MSVNYNITVRTQRLQQVATAIDAGPSSGFMRLLDSGNNVLSSLQLAKPCSTVANGLLTFLGMSLIDPAASATGNITGARFEDSTGTIVISGLTVGGVGGTTDILMAPDTFITAGQTVAITQATITGN